MSTKTLLKFGVAFGILAIVLIFLGVNFVPRIQAFSSVNGNIAESAIQVRPDFVDEAFPRAIAPQLRLVGSDWIERHPSNYYSNSDWIERHPVPVAAPVNYSGSDWIERHPSNYYSNSDWIERHPSISNYVRPIGTERFFTPPPMSTIRLYGTERFFTPPPADYTP